VSNANLYKWKSLEHCTVECCWVLNMQHSLKTFGGRGHGGNKITSYLTPWSDSASELYRPSRLSAKWLPTFCR
jgi:hypothetical protein